MPVDSSRSESFDSAAEWPRHERSRTSERHRRRRRARKGKSDVRAQIRLRIWIACMGALLVMAGALYYALGHGSGGESGHRLDGRPGAVARA
ncbi:MAG TPA: hypothetical protein VHL80_18700 [Polyangia bacterium]|nr:hypothetical protein [Polyangia bacterium]